MRVPGQESSAFSLSLLCWNVHGKPYAWSNEERLSNVAGVIVSEHPQLVVLQEVWKRADAHHLERALESQYELVSPHQGDDRLSKSGLLSFVRRDAPLRVDGSSFHAFADEAPAWRIWQGDGLAEKGIHRIELSRGDVSVTLLNTHLQAEYGELRYTDVRSNQLEQLQSVGHGMQRSTLVLAAGDLNTRPDESLYEFVTDFWVDLTEESRRRCDCGTVLVDDSGGEEWLDYILTRRAQNWTVTMRRFQRVVNDKLDDPYSDHHGLLAELDIRPTVTAHAALMALAVARATLGRQWTRREWLLGISQPLTKCHTRG